MKKLLFSLILTAVLLSSAIASSADSLLVNNISHAGTTPVLDAATVPDSVYGETVVMYIRNPLLDDIPLEDLSDFSGSFYSVWRDGKLYFHFTLKNFTEDDWFILYFDLEDSNEPYYSESKTASVGFYFNDGAVYVSSVGDIEESANTEAFLESAEVVSSVSGNTCIVEASFDFSTLYDGFSFGSGKRMGFDIAVFDSVDGGVVRYSWNDDTGVMMTNPDNLGTFVMGAPTVTEVEPDEEIEEDDGNPDTYDSNIAVYALICFGALFAGIAVSCRIKI